MKNLYIHLITLLVFTFSNAQIVDIPDANFKNALVNTNCVDTNGDGNVDSDADINNDGEIQVSEAEAVLYLNVTSENISSLEGIQSFINLEDLLCGSNNITSLNLSQNSNLIWLFGYENQLTNLDVSQSPNLEYILIDNNQLTDIDITQNSNLKRLWCVNNMLTSLDVTNNYNLRILDLENNALSNIDVSQNPNLISLLITNNQFTSLDISQNLGLKFLECDSNQLTSLDLSQNYSLLQLWCNDNQLVNLNIKNGNNADITKMWAYNNQDLNCIQVDDETATYPECDSNSGWCKDDWTEYSEECILGVEDNTNISFSIYPNPVQDILNLESQQPIERVKIYNLQGQLIMEKYTNSIDVSNLTTGLYFVQVTVNGKTITKKFIKE